MGFYREMISAGSKVSSKRVITFWAFILMAIAFLANLFFDCTIDPVIYESMKWIVGGGLTTIVAEQFTNKKTTSSTEEQVG